jgi:hypothetical protein
VLVCVSTTQILNEQDKSQAMAMIRGMAMKFTGMAGPRTASHPLPSAGRVAETRT